MKTIEQLAEKAREDFWRLPIFKDDPRADAHSFEEGAKYGAQALLDQLASQAGEFDEAALIPEVERWCRSNGVEFIVGFEMAKSFARWQHVETALKYEARQLVLEQELVARKMDIEKLQARVAELETTLGWKRLGAEVSPSPELVEKLIAENEALKRNEEKRRTQLSIDYDRELVDENDSLKAEVVKMREAYYASEAREHLNAERYKAEADRIAAERNK